MKSKKLSLNKSTVANLGNIAMRRARGGGDDHFEPGPVISGGDSCPCVLTQDNCPCPSTSSTTVLPTNA